MMFQQPQLQAGPLPSPPYMWHSEIQARFIFFPKRTWEFSEGKHKHFLHLVGISLKGSKGLDKEGYEGQTVLNEAFCSLTYFLLDQL